LLAVPFFGGKCTTEHVFVFRALGLLLLPVEGGCVLLCYAVLSRSVEWFKTAMWQPLCCWVTIARQRGVGFVFAP